MKKDSPKPAPYSNTDIAENEAINVFRSLIDKNFIKEEIKSRDKIPNTDGWVELVNNEQRPIGKLEVQIRKIKDGTRQYSCSDELVGYSLAITSPFLLICVDTKSKKAYWRQITGSMPEYKNDQKSFTIYFSENADSIDETGIYHQKWLEIIQDYQKRIQDFPVFSSEFATNVDPAKVSEDNRIWLQRFITAINGLFSNEFAVIKKVLYPGIAEFGVGVFYSDEERLYFQVYKIPYGKIAPHICQMKGGSLLSKKANPDGIAEFAPKRISTKTPEEIGKKFVLGRIAHAFQQKGFPPNGDLLAQDVLFSFINTYYVCLGLDPSKEAYDTEELKYALNKHLFSICAAYINEVYPEGNEAITLELRDVASYLMDSKLEPINPSSIKNTFFIESTPISLRTVFEALNYLSSTKKTSIKKASFDVKNILENSIDVYLEFLKENNFSFPDSPYLNWKTAIVFEVFPEPSEEFERPMLIEHHIDNKNKKLSKLNIFIRKPEEKLSFWESTPPGPVVDIDGIRYNPEIAIEDDGSFLYQETPLLNLIYRMLAKDFEIHYKMDVTNKHFPFKN